MNATVKTEVRKIECQQNTRDERNVATIDEAPQEMQASIRLDLLPFL